MNFGFQLCYTGTSFRVIFLHMTIIDIVILLFFFALKLNASFAIDFLFIAFQFPKKLTRLEPQAPQRDAQHISGNKTQKEENSYRR